MQDMDPEAQCGPPRSEIDHAGDRSTIERWSTRSLSLPDFVRCVRADLASHDGDWTQPGFQALAVHRLGNIEAGSRIGCAFLRRIYRVLNVMVRNCYGIEISASTRLGSGIRIKNAKAIIIHAEADIGHGCVLHQRVTVGAVSDARHWIAPTIGDGVILQAGAVVVGGVRVGDGARVGPNAVVLADVADGATVFAPSPKILRPSGSADATTGRRDDAVR